MTLVFAGNKNQFTYWCRVNGFNPDHGIVRFVNAVSDLYGVRAYRFVKYGTWFDRADKQVILDRHAANKLHDPEIEG